MHFLRCFSLGFEQLRHGFFAPPGLCESAGHIDQVERSALTGQSVQAGLFDSGV